MFLLIHKGRRAAFTLIELLVVILIMGILLAVAIPLYLSSVKNAAVNTAEANLKMMATAAQSYRVANGAYPNNETTLFNVGDIKQPQQNGVNYTLVGTATTCVITATENGADVFGSSATNDKIDYDVTSNKFTITNP